MSFDDTVAATDTADAAPSDVRVASAGPTAPRSAQPTPGTDGRIQAQGLHMLNVSHAFGEHEVLKGVSVFVEPGELVCLLGPSGCGKTTLLRLAAGLERLQTGRISMGDEVVADGTGTHIPPEARRTGLMFQDYALFPHLNVRKNIAFGLKGNVRSQQTWIDDALRRVGLSEHAESYPHTLSGGQQQRVALLRALAPEPRVLLLDEPFSGLDVTRRASVREETFAMLRETGVAALMVTHDPEEAMFMADRILVMNEGRIVQSGTPVEIYFHPATPFVAELFGPVNRLSSIVENGQAATGLGSFPAPGMADGDEVDIMVRPEAVRLEQTGPEGPLCVLAARPLGRSSHLVLKWADGHSGSINARVDGVFLPEPGHHVRATVAPDRALVFKPS